MFIDKLRFWSNKVLPTEYEDSLSYYEVLNKMSVKMNETIEAVNDNTEDITDALSQVSTAVNAANDAVSTANGAVSTANGAVSTANTALDNSEEAIETANESIVLARAKSPALYEFDVQEDVEKLVVKDCETGETIFDLASDTMSAGALAQIMVGDEGENYPMSPANFSYPRCNRYANIKIVYSSSSGATAGMFYGVLSWWSTGSIRVIYTNASGNVSCIEFTQPTQNISWSNIKFYDIESKKYKPLMIVWNTTDNTCSFYDRDGNEISAFNNVIKYLLEYTSTVPSMPISKIMGRNIDVLVGTVTADSDTMFTSISNAECYIINGRMVVSFVGCLDNTLPGQQGEFPTTLVNKYLYFMSSKNPIYNYSVITPIDPSNP